MYRHHRLNWVLEKTEKKNISWIHDWGRCTRVFHFVVSSHRALKQYIESGTVTNIFQRKQKRQFSMLNVVEGFIFTPQSWWSTGASSPHAQQGQPLPEYPGTGGSSGTVQKFMGSHSTWQMNSLLDL